MIIRDEFRASALLTGRVMGICLSVVQDNLLQNYSWSVLKIPEPNQKTMELDSLGLDSRDLLCNELSRSSVCLPKLSGRQPGPG